ncbi:MAG: hypothetical protein ABWK01_09690 [Infirmifilum sp.]
MRVRIPIASFLLFLLLVPSVYPEPSGVVNVKKTILREQDVLPGYGENTTITTTLVFDSAYNGSITDYLVFACNGNVVANAQPSKVVVDGERLGLIWNRVILNTGDSWKYSVNGKNLFHVDVILEADGKTLQPDCSKGYCYAVALRAHEINYTIRIESFDDLIRNQQLPISVSWSMDPMYLYPIDYSMSPQSLRESGTEVSFQWTGFINGSYTLSVIFEVRGENPWGEVLVPPPTVTISLDPRLQASLIEKYRSFTLKLLQENIGNITAFKENVTKLRDLLYNLSDGFEEEANILQNAARQADDAASAMDNAAAQLTQAVLLMNNAEDSLRSSLQNASEVIVKARELLSMLQGNITNLNKSLENLSNTLNLTRLNVSTSDIYSIVKDALSKLNSFQTELDKAKTLLDQYKSVKSQLSAGVENIRFASNKLRLMSSTLREAAGKLQELSKGLRQAAELIDASLLKMSRLLDTPVYPESFLQYNKTIFSQQVVSTTGNISLKTDLMSDVVYIAIPLVKLKRSEPQVSNVSLETPSSRVQAYWPLVFALVAAGFHFTLLRKRNDVEKYAATGLEDRIKALKTRLSSLEVSSNG